MKTWITYKDLIKQLPKSFKDKNRYYELQINYDSGMGCWHVGYAHEVSYEGYFFLIERFADELVDSLYELCVWCLEQGYLKFE